MLFGKMILHAILNRCAGLPGLSPAIVSYLSGSLDAAVEKLTRRTFQIQYIKINYIRYVYLVHSIV